jgi:hypothetical protein
MRDYSSTRIVEKKECSAVVRANFGAATTLPNFARLDGIRRKRRERKPASDRANPRRETGLLTVRFPCASAILGATFNRGAFTRKPVKSRLSPARDQEHQVARSRSSLHVEVEAATS